MSTILQQGDKIHLAVPISPTHDTPEAAHAEATRTATDLGTAFATQGVTILSWSGHSQLSHPVIVAVFRGEEPTQP
jgi:hypothetical protein